MTMGMVENCTMYVLLDCTPEWSDEHSIESTLECLHNDRTATMIWSR